MVERIYHTWDKWECYPAGFYDPKPPKGMTVEECKAAYCEFLLDYTRFGNAALRLIKEWPNSCEHYLTNERMNRIAWIGQAAMCLETGISKFFCGGYFQMSQENRDYADFVALCALNMWLAINGHARLTSEEAKSKTQADLY